MKKNIFNNQFVTIGIVAVVVALIMVVSQVNIHCLVFNENCTDTTEIIIESENQNYIILRKDIEGMSNQKWNKESFNRLKVKIADFAAPTPDALINEMESTGLSALLDSKYLILINDSVIQVLLTGTKEIQMYKLDNEIKLFKAKTNDKERLNGIETNIKLYKDVFNQCGAVVSYTANKPYIKDMTDNYKSTILGFASKPFLNKNKFISLDSSGLIKRHVQLLDEHMFMNNVYSNKNNWEEEKIRIKLDTCYCNKDHPKNGLYFTKYGHYKKLCDSLRNVVIKGIK